MWVVLLLCCSCAAAEPNEDSDCTPERGAPSQRGSLLQAAGLVVALISWNLNSFAPHVQEIESLKRSEGSVVLAAQEVRCTDTTQQKKSAQLSSWCLEWGEPMPHAEREVKAKGGTAAHKKKLEAAKQGGVLVAATADIGIINTKGGLHYTELRDTARWQEGFVPTINGSGMYVASVYADYSKVDEKFGTLCSRMR